MRAIKCFTIACSIAIVGYGEALMAGDVCSIQGKPKSSVQCLSSDCSFEERSFMIRFPDGREISILGQLHGHRDLNARVYEQLLQAPNDPASIRNRISTSRAQLNPDAIRQGQGDLLRLQRYVEAHPQITFLGSETSETRYQAIRESYRPGTNYLRLLVQAGIISSIDLEPILLLATSAPAYLDLARPAWLGNRIVRGFESHTLVDQESAVDSRSAQIRADVKRAFADRPEILKKISETIGQVYGLRMTDQMPSKTAELGILEQVKSTPELSPHGALVASLLESIFNEDHASLARDEYTAQNLAQTRMSGLFIVGQNHLLSLGRLLKKNCLEEQALGPPLNSQPTGQTGVK